MLPDFHTQPTQAYYKRDNKKAKYADLIVQQDATMR